MLDGNIEIYVGFLFTGIILPSMFGTMFKSDLHRTSAEFLYGTKLGEGSCSASANEAKFITVTDGAASERPVEKSL